ncbi:HAUS augmin-like complex subunit 8 [Aulostomus maculatus]
MASRRRTVAGHLNNGEAKGTKTGNKDINSGTGKKPANAPAKSSGSIVRSRYLQSAEKSSLSKSHSSTNESVSGSLRPSSPRPSGVKPRVGTPPRRSLAPQALRMSMMSNEMETLSMIGRSVLQSTFSDEHCSRPDFDLSVIKDKTVLENPEGPEAESNPGLDKSEIEMQTFLLAYLAAKMENNTAKLKKEAEARLLEAMEREEVLRKEVQEKKRQYLLMEKKRQMNELLDLQISVLAPVAETAEEFTKNYKSFAAAVDSTRHELPVQNFYIDGDRREFLEKAEACLRESEGLLQDCTEGGHEDNCAALQCLKDIKKTSRDASQQLSGVCSELLELTPLLCRQTIQVQQAAEEGQLGAARTRELFVLKP